MNNSYALLASEITEAGVQDFKEFSLSGASVGGARGRGAGFDVNISSANVRVNEPFNLIRVLAGIVIVAVVAILFLPTFREPATGKSVSATPTVALPNPDIEYKTTPATNDDTLTSVGVTPAKLLTPAAPPTQIPGADEIAASIASSATRIAEDAKRIANASKKHGHAIKPAANEPDEGSSATSAESAPNSQNSKVDLETLRRLQGKM